MEPFTPMRRQFGSGMGMIPLGDGVVGIRAIVDALKATGFDGPTTLEVAGPENVKCSAQRLFEPVKYIGKAAREQKRPDGKALAKAHPLSGL